MDISPIEDSQPTPNSSDVVVHHDHDNLVPPVSESNGYFSILLGFLQSIFGYFFRDLYYCLKVFLEID